MQNRSIGIALVVIAATLWGASGIMAEVFYMQAAVTTEWIVSTRLLFSGLFILLYGYFQKRPIFNIFKSKHSRKQLLIFGLLIMTIIQYTFFKTIELSDASTATILQYTGPIFIFLYLVLSGEKQLHLREFSYIALAVTGVFLIVTNGNVRTLSISMAALIVGLSSAVAMAFYNIQPRQLINDYGAIAVSGWGMLIAGLIFQFVQPFWLPEAFISQAAGWNIFLIIFVGTAIPYLLYLSSLNYIPIVLASTLVAIEPLTTSLLSLIIFNREFKIFEMIGVLVVILAVYLLSTFDATDSTTS